MGFRAGGTNLYRYVGNSPTNFTDPSGLWAEPRGQADEDDFRDAAGRSGVDPALLDLILDTAKSTPINTDSAGIGAHQICVDWVFTFEQRLNDALRKKQGTPATRGITGRGYLVLDVPLGSQGNTLDDISMRNRFLPSLLDLLNSGGPARNGSTNGLPGSGSMQCDPDYYKKKMLGQIHTVYRLTLADGSTWYVDLGAIQGILGSGSNIDDLTGGTWVITPSTGIPQGWTPTNRTVQASWESRLD